MFEKSVETVQRHDWTPITIHQPVYNLLDRWVEPQLLSSAERAGTGVIVFSPLAQGRLTAKYLDPKNPLPKASRASEPDGFLQPSEVTPDLIARVRQLGALAEARGQSIAQVALAWILRDPRITSALIGARNTTQVIDCVETLKNLEFTQDELAQIDALFPAEIPR